MSALGRHLAAAFQQEAAAVAAAQDRQRRRRGPSTSTPSTVGRRAGQRRGEPVGRIGHSGAETISAASRPKGGMPALAPSSASSAQEAVAVAGDQRLHAPDVAAW